jgi:minor curlin subunit
MKKLSILLASAMLASAAPAFAESRASREAGANNTAIILQNGDDNTLRLNQRGSDLTANLTQNGDDNRLKLKQFGSGESATIVQNGGEHATVIQGSPGNGNPRRVGMQRHLD